jgi:hypothetical protein
MLRKDYIVRQAEEFGKFLAILMGLRKAGNWEEFHKQINASAKKFTFLEVEEAENLDPEKFLEILIEQHQLKEQNLKMLADLLYEKGMSYTASNNTDAANNAFERALGIFTYISEQALEIDFSLDMHFKMAALKQLLNK